MHRENSSTGCQNCGDPRVAKFCPNCGEKKFDPHELTVKHFAEETFEVFSHFDNKFFRTLKTLFFKPGKLTFDYCRGIRVPYMKPMAFFLVTNVLFFLFVTRANTFNIPLYNYVTYRPFTLFGTREAAIKKLKKEHLSEQQYSMVFHEKMKSNSKALLVVFIPFMGLICALVLLGSKKTFGEHLVFATHFVTFFLYVVWLLSYLAQITYSLFGNDNIDTVIAIIAGTVMSIYAHKASRRFYDLKWGKAFLVSLLLLVFFIAFTLAYRMLLFYKIIHFG